MLDEISKQPHGSDMECDDHNTDNDEPEDVENGDDDERMGGGAAFHHYKMLVKRIKAASVQLESRRSFKKAAQEFDYVKYVPNGHVDKCLCEKEIVKNYVIRNRLDHNEYVVGSRCIRRFRKVNAQLVETFELDVGKHNEQKRVDDVKNGDVKGCLRQCENCPKRFRFNQTTLDRTLCPKCCHTQCKRCGDAKVERSCLNDLTLCAPCTEYKRTHVEIACARCETKLDIHVNLADHRSHCKKCEQVIAEEARAKEYKEWQERQEQEKRRMQRVKERETRYRLLTLDEMSDATLCWMEAQAVVVLKNLAAAARAKGKLNDVQVQLLAKYCDTQNVEPDW
jgi:DNA-binding protein H-NS